MTHAGPCPSEQELSDAFTEGGDDALYEHLAQCPACCGQWDSLDDLRDLASGLRSPELVGAEVEATRAALLSRVDRQAPARRPLRRISYMIPAVAAVALALAVTGAAVWFWAERTEPAVGTAHEPAYLSTVHAQEGAHYALVSGAPNEIIRLHSGRVTVAVDKLQADQRLRVLTGDAEVEVRGTVFDVEAKDDTLVAVRVIEGVVEVRRGGETHTLGAGERWDAPALATVAPVVKDDKAMAPEGGAIEVAGGTGDDARVDDPRVGDDGTDGKHVDAARPRGGVEVAGGVGDDARLEGGRAARPVREGRRNAARAQVKRPGVDRARDPAPARVLDPRPVAAQEMELAPEKVAPAAEPDPTEAERHFQDAWRAFEAGDHREAARAFGRVGDKGPSGTLAADAAFWRAVALDRAGESERAEAALGAFLRGWPRGRRSGAARAMLGWKRLRAGDARTARHLFRASLNDPSPKVRASAQAGLEEADLRLERAR